MPNNEQILLLRAKIALDLIFRDPALCHALLQSVSDEQYDYARETWYLLNRRWFT